MASISKILTFVFQFTTKQKIIMAKGMNSQKSAKKEPLKTAKEKKAEKAEKKDKNSKRD